MALSTASFLRDHSGEIVRTWEASVIAEAPSVPLAGTVLRNHVPELLKELADWLQTEEPPGAEAVRLAAVVHAADRLKNGFELKQFIHEVRLLRNPILLLLLGKESAQQQNDGKAGMPVRVIELARLNAGLDFAIADSVEWFVAERERQLVAAANREAELARQSDQRKSDFLAVLSHELRNPLAPIVNGLAVLDRAEPGSEPAARARQVIHRQTRHLTNLVDDLLDSTRLSRGKVELHREYFELRDLARITFDDHREIFQQRGVSISLEVAPGPVPMYADPTRIAQVLSNLMQNAAKFTPRGGRVSVAIHAEDGHALLRVRDTGTGMEPEVVARVFEAFVQGPQDIARQHGGLGLGLALVKGFVELHGGSVSAYSAGVGRGSEFLVKLPLAPMVAASDSGPPRQSKPPPSCLILIIEDNIDAGDALAQMLEFSGHRTHVARDGHAGIALARELKPDVILCDVGLPDMDGYEVARLLRADQALSRTRLVALTGYAQPEDKQRVAQAGFDAHLAKPATLEDLSAILARQ
jgi:signal transduction histidine kinase/CheY-like chemotaxis protein